MRRELQYLEVLNRRIAHLEHIIANYRTEPRPGDGRGGKNPNPSWAILERNALRWAVAMIMAGAERPS